MAFDRPVTVRPDSTLNRVKDLINNQTKIEWIRILNLSDIVEAKSNIFFKKVSEFEASDSYQHSIFSFSRRQKLLDLLNNGDLAIVACGTNVKNKDLLKHAIEALESIGVRILNRDNKFYHPLARPNKSINIIDWRIQATKYYSQHRFGNMRADE